MPLRNTTRHFVIFALLFIANANYAWKSDEIPCPVVQKIKQSAHLINAAKFNGHHNYNPYTKSPVFYESSMDWGISAGNIYSKNEIEAITLGQRKVSKVSSLLAPNPIKIGEWYVCSYYSEQAPIPEASMVVGIGNFFNLH